MHPQYKPKPGNMADSSAGKSRRRLSAVNFDPPIIDMNLDESTRTASSTDALNSDLRRNYQNAIDCLMHCEHIINDLTSQMTKKDELIASLEERIVQMSLELASSKAFEDEYRSKRRISSMDIATDDSENESDDGGSNKSSRSGCTGRSNSSESTQRRPRFRRASCADEDEPTPSVEAAGLFRRRSRFGRTPSRDTAHDDEGAPTGTRRASSLDMEHKKTKKSPRKGRRSGHRRASCTEIDHQSTHTIITKQPWPRWGNDNNEDEAYLDESTNTASTAPLDDSLISHKSSTLDESTNSTRMSLSLGHFFRGLNREQVQQQVTSGEGSMATTNTTARMEEEMKQTSEIDEQGYQPRRQRTAARAQRSLQQSSRSFLDGVVFPLSEEDVDRYVE
jgi:hypothetical protein